jgi:hypothetical protein
MHYPRQGITLLELVLAMAISLAILAVIMVAYFAGVRTFTQEMSRFDIFWDAHKALDAVTDDIRNCDDVISSEADSINLWCDLDADTTMEANEYVSFYLSDQKLMRTLSGESRLVVDNVESFVLEYDDDAYPTLVTVTLTMNKAGHRATLEGKANIRMR